MKHLVVLFGRKQSGKTTSATAIYGYHLTQKGIIPNANFDNNGTMTVVYDKNKNEGVIFDIDSREDFMVDFYKKNVWAHVKHVSFADALKESCSKLFSIDPKYIYGTNEDKNRETHIKWADLAKLLTPERASGLMSKKHEFVTIRKLLEVFGTDICRVIDDACHIRSADTAIRLANPEIGIIPDGRFENEFNYFYQKRKTDKKTKIWLIKHARSAFKSSAPSEQGLPEISDKEYDLVIPEGLDMAEKNSVLLNFLIENKVLSSTGVKSY